jgi:hypothetical protein
MHTHLCIVDQQESVRTHLAAPTIRIAYEEAMSKTRNRLALTIAPVGKPIVSNRIEWLREEMLKTRVAHGYCYRPRAAEACPYANICEQCDNFVTTTEFNLVLQAQLADITAPHDDAAERGWDTEVARHARVIDLRPRRPVNRSTSPSLTKSSLAQRLHRPRHGHRPPIRLRSPLQPDSPTVQMEFR